jgi:hypothetical protein
VHTKIALVGLGTLLTFLMATNPVVADTARQVAGQDIKNNSVTGKDIRNGSVTGKDVRNQSLRGADIAESSLGKVPAARSADTVAPNSITGVSVTDRSLRADDFAVAGGTVHLDMPSIPANDCAYSLVPTGASLDGVAVFVSAGQSATFANGGLSLHVAKSNIPTSFRLVACNVTAAAIDPAPAPFDYVALR